MPAHAHVPTPDLSTTPRSIWRLTWPQMLMMFLVFCIGFTDVWTAGHISGDVQAAFGIVTQCVMFMLMVVMAMSSGGMAAVSQSIGAGRSRRARRYIAMMVLGSLGLGLLAAALGYFSQGLLFRALMVPDAILPITREYWGISLLTLPAQYVFSATGVMFRATRQVFQPLWVTAAVWLCNLFGNLGFGLGYWGLPAHGYVGIAWTTFGALLLGALLNCLLLIRSGWLDRRDIPPLRWVRRGARYLINVALPAGATQVVWQTGYLTLFAIVASLPYDSVNALAGFTAGLRVEALLFLPGQAFGMTASILVGNSLGACNRAEARRLARLLVACGCGFMTLAAAVIWPFMSDIAAQLSQVPGVQAQIVDYLRFNLVSAPFTAASMILGGVMVGAGATRYNLAVFGSCFWLVRLPLAWLFGHIIWADASGVFMAMLASQIVQSAIMLHVLLQRDWMRFAMHHNCHSRSH